MSHVHPPGLVCTLVASPPKALAVQLASIVCSWTCCGSQTLCSLLSLPTLPPEAAQLRTHTCWPAGMASLSGLHSALLLLCPCTPAAICALHMISQHALQGPPMGSSSIPPNRVPVHVRGNPWGGSSVLPPAPVPLHTHAHMQSPVMGLVPGQMSSGSQAQQGPSSWAGQQYMPNSRPMTLQDAQR